MKIDNRDKILVIAIMLAACSPFSGEREIFSPREIDWKKEWKENQVKLKQLTQDVKENKENKYKLGNNSFPSEFNYPFDEGFYINYGSHKTIIDTNQISVRYYVDRGVVDHYSAFIYTKDSNEIMELDFKVKESGNDYKIENNWYMITTKDT